jgi:hypothetical protein
MRLSAVTLAFASSLLLSSVAFADETPAATGTAAPAATATPAPAATAATPTDDGDAVTCRYEKSTGSLFSKRICHTQREWKQMSTDSHDLMDRLDDHSRLNGGLGGGN